MEKWQNEILQVGQLKEDMEKGFTNPLVSFHCQPQNTLRRKRGHYDSLKIAWVTSAVVATLDNFSFNLHNSLMR